MQSHILQTCNNTIKQEKALQFSWPRPTSDFASNLLGDLENKQHLRLWFPHCKVRNWITSRFLILGSSNIFLELHENFFKKIFICHLDDLPRADYHHSILMPLAVGLFLNSLWVPNTKNESAVLETEKQVEKLSWYEVSSSKGRPS